MHGIAGDAGQAGNTYMVERPFDRDQVNTALDLRGQIRHHRTGTGRHPYSVQMSALKYA